MRARPSRPILAAVLAAVLLVTSAGAAGAVTVRVRGVFDGSFVWKPKTRSIDRGDAIRWRAVEGSHNVQSRGSNWSYFRSLPEGTAVTRTFNRTGVFKYYCTIHGDVGGGTCTGMCGKIVVS